MPRTSTPQLPNTNTHWQCPSLGSQVGSTTGSDWGPRAGEEQPSPPALRLLRLQRHGATRRQLAVTGHGASCLTP
eukprot:2876587-Rhodomonas_salina.4